MAQVSVEILRSNGSTARSNLRQINLDQCLIGHARFPGTDNAATRSDTDEFYLVSNRCSVAASNR